MIIDDEIKGIMAKLAEPLPSEAIQRTKGAQTRKGYDTDGYGYQFGVNRFNSVLGDKWGFNYKILESEKGKYGTGGDKIEITIECVIWILKNDQDHLRSCVGGHTSKTYCDALKGAITNGFKKTAAFWGVGRHAYEGALDDDNDPATCAFEDQQQESGKKPNGSNGGQQQKPPQQTQQQTQPQRPQKEKQGTIAGENGNGKGITTQKLCGMVAKVAGSDFVGLWKKYCYKQYNLKSLTDLSVDQLKAENGYLKAASKRPNDFKKFLENYRDQPAIDSKEGMIKTIKSKLIKIFDGNRDRIDFFFSGLGSSVATIDDLSKLSHDELIDIFNKVEITYNEYMEAQSHIEEQKAAVN